MNVIQARIDVRYPAFSLQAALSFPARGISALFGPSGSGKTTVLRTIAGLERHGASYVQIGEEVWQDSARNIFAPVYERSIGFVFQDARLFEHLSVKKNIAFGMQRVPQHARHISCDRAIDLLGIGHLMDRHPATLSGGERQRVGIARALATSPKLLLMDEPLAALDTPRKQEILPYLERLNQELDIPILYVSHAIDEVARLADYMVLLQEGKHIASGPIDEMLTRFDLPLAFGDTAAAIIDGRVIERDEAFDLASVEFAGGRIVLPNNTVTLGQRVRLRIQARDVSLTLEPQSGTSILNSLSVIINDMSNDAAGQVMIGLDANGTRLLCRITRKSASALDLAPGRALFAQIKGVAII